MPPSSAGLRCRQVCCSLACLVKGKWYSRHRRRQCFRFLPCSFLPSSLTCLLSSQYLSISPRIGENNSCRVRISVESGWTWELKQGNETKCNEMNVYLHLPRYVGTPYTTKLMSSKPVYLDLYRAQKSLCTWLGECCRQVEAEEVSNSRNKIHQTMYQDFFRALY